MHNIVEEVLSNDNILKDLEDEYMLKDDVTLEDDNILDDIYVSEDDNDSTLEDDNILKDILKNDNILEDDNILKDLEDNNVLEEESFDFEGFNGEYGPYFPNFTSAMIFIWITKHMICE